MVGRFVGKKAEPTGEELEFIYSRLERLSDSEILEDMQDTTFPLRSLGFIKRRRKEFNAAKRVLGENLAERMKNESPVYEKAREQHFGEIHELIKDLYDVTRTPYPLEISLAGWSDNRFVDNVGNLTDEYGLIGALRLLENNGLFNSLKEHIPSEMLWFQYSQWKKLAQCYLDSCTELVRRFLDDNRIKDYMIKHPTETRIFFYRPLLRFITEKALGNEPDLFSEQLPEEPEDLDQLKLKAAAPYNIFDSRDLDIVIPEACVQFLASEPANKIVLQYRELKDLEDAFRNGLRDAYLSRSYVTTKCHLCPGQ